MPYCWGMKGAVETGAELPLFLYLHGSGPKEREWSTGLKICRNFDDAPSVYFIPQIPNEGDYYRWWQKAKPVSYTHLDVQIGSITGGGRYDNLTGVFGMTGVSGVGISFGADRIFDVLNQLDLYPKEAVNGTELLFVNFGEKEAAFSMNMLAKVRAAGIRAEIFPDAAKMKKQMSYANAKNIPFVAIVGENEMNEGKAMLKNMETGEQNLVSVEELIAKIK